MKLLLRLRRTFGRESGEHLVVGSLLFLRHTVVSNGLGGRANPTYVHVKHDMVLRDIKRSMARLSRPYATDLLIWLTPFYTIDALACFSLSHAVRQVDFKGMKNLHPSHLMYGLCATEDHRDEWVSLAMLVVLLCKFNAALQSGHMSPMCLLLTNATATFAFSD